MKRIIHTDRLVLRPAYIGDAGRVVQIMEYDLWSTTFQNG